MKRKNYFLKIESPCLQDWSSMTPNEIGRFCAQCSKTVVDFTSLSDEQIIAYLQKSVTHPCMRLTQSQHNRVIVPAKERIHASTLSKFLSGLLLIGSTQSSMATQQTVPKELIEPSFINGNTSRLAQEKKDETEYGTIKIKLQDKATDEAIPFANIVAFQHGVQVGVTTTNMDGEGIIKSLKPGTYTLKGIYVGYQVTEMREVLVAKDKTSYVVIPLSSGAGVNLEELNVLTYQARPEPETSMKITREDYDLISHEEIVMGVNAGEYEPDTIQYIEPPKTKKWWQFWKKKN